MLQRKTQNSVGGRFRPSLFFGVRSILERLGLPCVPTRTAAPDVESRSFGGECGRREMQRVPASSAFSAGRRGTACRARAKPKRALANLCRAQRSREDCHTFAGEPAKRNWTLWGGGRLAPLRRILARALVFAACLLVAHAGDAQIRLRRFKPKQAPRAPAYRPVRVPPAKPLKAAQDPAAVALVHKMLAQATDYRGQQVTERTIGQGVHLSRQVVRGDSKRRVRLDFSEPTEIEGDVMFIFPNMYRYFHHDTRVLDIALWPTGYEGSGQERRIANMIDRKLISVMKVGDETVVGRQTGIVLLKGQGVFGGGQGFQDKLWIDLETGVKLKQEISGPMGRLISRSYFTDIAYGPASGVVPKDFEPAFLQNTHPNPLFPADAKHFDTVAQAASQLPFAPMEPGTLPTGFALRGIWLFPSPAKAAPPAVLLRYSDGVTIFNLFEKPVRANNAPLTDRTKQRITQRYIQRWRLGATAGTMEVVYIGNLPARSVKQVFDSLR